MTRVLVTGANGFVGQTLCAVLVAAGYRVRAALRSERPLPAGVSESRIVGEIDAATPWEGSLADVDLVVHLAARVHRMAERGSQAGHYEATNVWGTRRLAQAAAAAGVRRLVLLSTVKVNGGGPTSMPYGAEDEPHPEDVYAESKWLAEKALMETAAG